MADLLVIATVLVFFALCLAFVRGCDRIIGPDEDDMFEDAPVNGAPVNSAVVGVER